jgi:protein-L-isoaspartate(D-aspartate) O-methyltransferase
LADASGGPSERLIAAFSSVHREHFVGPGPWSVHLGAGYEHTPSDDVPWLYQDVVVAIDTKRGIHNGLPSLHAQCIRACDPKIGDIVVHVGTGTGYYTAILAAMVGATGRVIGYEIEPDLAERARRNLADLSNVAVVPASATCSSVPDADVIYVSAGATHPASGWLDALKPDGRLIFPLTPDADLGCMLLVQRVAPRSYAASCLSRVACYPCIGARNPEDSTALAKAMDNGAFDAVRSLRRSGQPDASAWYVVQGWWLSTAEPLSAQ